MGNQPLILPFIYEIDVFQLGDIRVDTEVLSGCKSHNPGVVVEHCLLDLAHKLRQLAVRPAAYINLTAIN